MHLNYLPLLLAILPALCWTYHLARAPKLSCQTATCICTDGEAEKGQAQKQMAICKDLPQEKLPGSVVSLTIQSESLGNLTKERTKLLGQELLTLDLSNCNIESIERGAFDSMTKLRTLKLSGNMITSIPSTMFKRNKALKQLYLDGNRLVDLDQSVFTKLDRLRELQLQHNRLVKIPSKIPLGVTKLDISYNRIGPMINTQELQLVNLKESLNLCGNSVGKLTASNLKHIEKVQALCLGDMEVDLPLGTAQLLPHLMSLTLLASADTRAELSRQSQLEIGSMAALDSLSLVNFEVNSLYFIKELRNLVSLKLENVVTSNTTNVSDIFTQKPFLKAVLLDKSIELSRQLSSNMQLITEINTLHSVSMCNASIRRIQQFTLPNHDFKLDISQNPLDCDCQLQWLQNKEEVNMGQLLMSANATVCEQPSQFHEKMFTEVVDSMSCLEANEQHKSGSSPLVGPATSQNDEEHKNIGKIEHWVISEETSSQVITEGQPLVTEEQPLVTEEQPLVTEEHQSVTEETILNPVENEPTIEPIVTELENNTNAIHDFMQENADDPNKAIYIALSCVIVILLIVGIVLAVVYWHFRMRGVNQIEPLPTENVQQSFRELQAKDDENLIRAKK